jgi:endonuclease YncB( thermonuclease family)
VPVLHPARLPHAFLHQMLPSNVALQAGKNAHTIVAQKLAARRHHHHFRPWVWGFFPVGVYGLAGRVVSVPSGNSLMVTNAAGVPTRVRLFGAVAPMAGQFAIASKGQLESEVGGRFVHVHQTGVDLDGAIVAKVFHAGSYVNRDQVASGMAWYSMEDGLDLDLARAEEGAQGSSTGLWSDPYLVAPWVAADDRHPASKFPWTGFSVASADQLR